MKTMIVVRLQTISRNGFRGAMLQMAKQITSMSQRDN